MEHCTAMTYLTLQSQISGDIHCLYGLGICHVGLTHLILKHTEYIMVCVNSMCRYFSIAPVDMKIMMKGSLPRHW